MADAAGEARAGRPEAPEAGHRFSFACFPLERVLVLVGIFVGLAIAGGIVWQYGRMVELSQSDAGSVVYEMGDARLFAGLTVVMAVLLVVYGLVYLQLRAATTVEVTDARLVWTRSAVLPFGWLARHRSVEWKRAGRVELHHRRTLLGGRQPMLEVETSNTQLRLNVADAWPADGPTRPWIPRPPKGGWSEHPLVTTAMTAYAAAISPAPLKSNRDNAD